MEIIPIVSALDGYRIVHELGIKTFVQHIDSFQSGRWTGKISGFQAQTLGIAGALFNHSEDKLPKGELLSTLKIIPEDFESIICVRSTTQALFWSKKKPTYIAYEPAALIASKTKSVASEDKGTIAHLVKLIAPLPLIVGAGIKNGEDAKKALDEGAQGILVARAVVESDNPEKTLLDLAEGIQQHGLN